jgi:hypothetical protein
LMRSFSTGVLMRSEYAGVRWGHAFPKGETLPGMRRRFRLRGNVKAAPYASSRRAAKKHLF